ncbi:MAG: molybdenum cofactor guanylyltransferase [Desulfobacterales bacterium]|nr:molybdenum cofactor guanylyltransferase [Desulfobacterales bacterium]
MSSACTGVILAGGENSRFSGEQKTLMKIGGIRILDRIFDVMTAVFDDIILVTNTPERYLEWDATIVTDLLPVRSSLTGIHTGLFYTRTDYAFVTAGDAPFLKKEMVATVVDGISPGIDIVIPETKYGREPLCAVYARSCLESAGSSIGNGRFKIMPAFRKKNAKVISEKTARKADPRLLSFFNVNTPEDLRRANIIAREIEEL